MSSEGESIEAVFNYSVLIQHVKIKCMFNARYKLIINLQYRFDEFEQFMAWSLRSVVVPTKSRQLVIILFRTRRLPMWWCLVGEDNT